MSGNKNIKFATKFKRPTTDPLDRSDLVQLFIVCIPPRLVLI